MNKILEKMRELLTKIKGLDTIEFTDNDLLTIHRESLASYSPEQAMELLNNNPIFKSVHDKHVTEIVNKTKKASDDLLLSKDEELIKLRDLAPRPTSPEAIKKKIESTTDVGELRILNLELQNALTSERAEKLEADNKAQAAKNAQAELQNRINSHIKEKNYSVTDSSLFVQFGEDAINKIDAYAESNKKLFDAELSKIAAKKYGSDFKEIGGKPSNDNIQVKSLEEIAKLPTRDERNKEMTIRNEALIKK